MISLDKLQKQDSEYGLRDSSKYSNVNNNLQAWFTQEYISNLKAL